MCPSSLGVLILTAIAFDDDFTSKALANRTKQLMKSDTPNMYVNVNNLYQLNPAMSHEGIFFLDLKHSSTMKND